MWKKLSVNDLRQLYENLEIWYNYPNHPKGQQTVRAAFRPFYRVPESVNLQQFMDRQGFVDNTWVEVFHAGHMNTDFYIPFDLFAGTFYYPAKGSGVFLPMGRSLVAVNKVDALKKLKVPNEVIKEHAKGTFRKWLASKEKQIALANPNMTEEEVQQLALDEQIKAMASGQNKIKTKKGFCYYGLGSGGDGLLAKAAIQEGYDTIQLIHEAQLGCDPRGVLDGFEIIDLRNPLTSASRLRMAVPKDYDPRHGYYHSQSKDATRKS